MCSDKKIQSLELAVGNFPPHGHTEIYPSGEIVTAHASGPFNVEGVLAANLARVEYLQTQPIVQPRCQLTVWHGSALMSKEAIQVHRDGIEAAYGDGKPKPLAIAWVADGEVEGFDLMAAIYMDNFASVHIPLRLFHSLEEAQQWLHNCLQDAA